MYSKIVQLARLYHLFQHENGKVFTNVESQMQKSNVDFKYGISFTKRESRIAIHPSFGSFFYAKNFITVESYLGHVRLIFESIDGTILEDYDK